MAAREDASEGSDARKTGERLLRRVGTLLRGETPEHPRDLEHTEKTYESSPGAREIHDLVDGTSRPECTKEMEKAPDDLKKAQDQKENSLSKSPSPNPRKLG